MIRGIYRSFSKVPTDSIRKLRDMTGAPLLQCKTMLIECDGDIDKAKDMLREKNLIFADRKAGANAGEGVRYGSNSAMGVPDD